MKKGIRLSHLFAFLAAALLSVSTVLAADKPFSLAIGENDSLIIFAPDGKQIATLPTATVGRTVEAPPYSFQVSYGKDANGNLSVIITPNPDHPTSLTFTFGNREVTMDRASVVTLTLADGGKNVIIDPGYTGVVRVDGKTTTATTDSTGAPVTVASNNTTGGGAAVPAEVPGPTAQQPNSTNGPSGDANGLNDLPSSTLAPAINNNGAAVFSPVTNPARTTPI